MTHTGHPDGRPASVRAVSAPPEATPVDIPSPTQAASDSGAAGSTATGSGSFRNRERSEFEKILRSLASLKITVWLPRSICKCKMIEFHYKKFLNFSISSKNWAKQVVNCSEIFTEFG